jgi:hypothetical protein
VGALGDSLLGRPRNQRGNLIPQNNFLIKAKKPIFKNPMKSLWILLETRFLRRLFRKYKKCVNPPVGYKITGAL